MKKIFEKYETLFCILLIIVYIIVNSYCIQNFGIEDYRSTIVNFLISIGLIVLIISLKSAKCYGLTKPVNSRKFLYFLPLILIASVNLWNGININNTKNEILFHILTMINVGFIEEIIFRGFLFRAMEKNNVKSAIIVSSITFGFGHIINLLSSGLDNLVPNICQVFYATAVGFLFVIMFYKGGSLLACIITHSLVNALSVFQNTIAMTNEIEIIISLVIITVAVLYSIILLKTLKESQSKPL